MLLGNSKSLETLFPGFFKRFKQVDSLQAQARRSSWQYIDLTAKRIRRNADGQVASQFYADKETQISRKPVLRCFPTDRTICHIHAVYVPFLRIPSSARMKWCRLHRHWTEDYWTNFFFADESRFNISSDSWWKLIWLEVGIAYRPENIPERNRYGQASSSMATPHYTFLKQGPWPLHGTLLNSCCLMFTFPVLLSVIIFVHR